MVINILIMRLTEGEAWVVQAFADDPFVAAQNPAVYRFADIISSVLSEIHC